LNAVTYNNSNYYATCNQPQNASELYVCIAPWEW